MSFSDRTFTIAFLTHPLLCLQLGADDNTSVILLRFSSRPIAPPPGRGPAGGGGVFLNSALRRARSESIMQLQQHNSHPPPPASVAAPLSAAAPSSGTCDASGTIGCDSLSPDTGDSLSEVRNVSAVVQTTPGGGSAFHSKASPVGTAAGGGTLGGKTSAATLPTLHETEGCSLSSSSGGGAASRGDEGVGHLVTGAFELPASAAV